MKTKPKNKSGLIASGGSLAGLFGLIGASCCVLPFVLINLGLSSAIVANLNFFARGKYWFLGIALLLIIAGFFTAYRGGRRPARRTLVLLILATIFIIAAFVLPFFEGDMLRWLKQK